MLTMRSLATQPGHFALVLLPLVALGSLVTGQVPVQFGANFYEFVSANITWQGAVTAASNRSHLGVQGHLATITTPGENAFLLALAVGQPGQPGAWAAGQVDSGGVGRWAAGPENGQIFSTGQTPASGAFANWGGVEPNNAPSFLWMNIGPAFAGIGTGQWADDDDGAPSPADPVTGYFVEYETPLWNAFGSGCPGPAGVPVLVAASQPNLGSTFRLEVSTMPPQGGLYVVNLGFSDVLWQGLGALPYELAGFGAPQCYVFCDSAGTVIMPNVGGLGTFDLPIPGLAVLTGLVFFQQAFVFDPAANALGLTATNAGRALVQ